MIDKWRQMKLLSRTSNDVVLAIDKRGWEHTFDNGEPVIWEGDKSESVYFVLKGAVEIYRNSIEGREHTLGIMKSGDCFNLVPVLIENGENVANARCLQQTEILLIKNNDFSGLLRRFPDFSNEVLKEVATRLAAMTKKTGELALKNVLQRLAAFLVKEADNATKGEMIFWTRDDMARQIGSVRDVVTRHLRVMEEKGLIRRDKGKIKLINREGLEMIIKGNDTT